MAKLYIVRGLPGSGKSTFAKNLGCFHIESDMYFIKKCAYEFNHENIKKAHEWCYHMVVQAMIHGVDVAVSNTFTQHWEFEKYLNIASTYHYEVEVIRIKGEYKNIHNVPEDVMEKMKNRFEKYPDETVIVG